MRELRRGVKTRVQDRPDIRYLQSRLDYDEVLEGLGIDVAYHLGDQIMCHCPNPDNHSNGDRNPSFGFNTEEMIYNCFVCGGGTLLDLVVQQLVVSDDDAVAWLTNSSTLEPKSASEIRQKLAQMMNPVKEKTVIPSYPIEKIEQFRQPAQKYFLDRGITAEVQAHMRTGFDEEHYAVVIPHVWRGDLVGWQWRHLIHEGDTYYCMTCGDQTAKYKSTPGFPKKITLYGYDDVVEMGYQSVIVVESPMTVLYLRSCGYINVVATFGSWSEEQMNYLTVFPTVYLWPDNDPAGANNLHKAIDVLSKQTNVRIVPVVDKPHGDGADVHPKEIINYLEMAILPGLLPLYKSPLPTLAEALANTKQ